MIVTFTIGRNKKSYDLTQKRQPANLKSFISRKINEGNVAALEIIGTALTQVENPSEFLKNQLVRVQQGLVKLKTQPQYNVTFFGKTFDLNRTMQFKPCRNYLNKSVKAKRIGSERKITTLKTLLERLRNLDKEYPKVTTIEQLLERTKLLLEQLNSKQNYQSYAIQLEKEFNVPRERGLNRPYFKHSYQEFIPKYQNQTSLNDYLQTPVSKKKKRGQDNLEELTYCFWLDFLYNQQFFSVQGDRQRVIYYLVIVKSFFSHISSYYPAQGYGKSNLEECQQPLFYQRSQADHHEIKKYKQRINQSKSFGLQNVNMLKMAINGKIIKDQSYLGKLNNVKENGVKEKKTIRDRTGDYLRHLGSRANNVSLFYKLMEQAYDNSLERKKNKLQNNFTELNSYFPMPPKQTLRWDAQELSNSIKFWFFAAYHYGRRFIKDSLFFGWVSDAIH